MNVRLGKAGRSRWLGRRPHVRGVAMNPVDHPMGGGEGPDLRRPPPLLADRRARQGRQDPPPPQAVKQGHHPPSPQCPLRPAQDLTTYDHQPDPQRRLNVRHEQDPVRHGTFAQKRPLRRRAAAREGDEGRYLRQREPIKTWARACTIVPEFVGKHFASKRAYSSSFMTEDMVDTSSASPPPPAPSGVTAARRPRSSAPPKKCS